MKLFIISLITLVFWNIRPKVKVKENGHFQQVNPPRPQRDIAEMDLSEIANLVFKGIRELQQTDVLTDFTINVGQKSFRCHKVVLASVSDYFRAMFTSGMQETVSNEMTFEDILPESMEQIINFLYPKSNKFGFLHGKDDDKVADLLNLAVRLQIACVKDTCLAHFRTTMVVENCIQRWKMSEVMLTEEFKDVKSSAWKCILDNFDELSEKPELLSLDFDDFIEIIACGDLKVESEDNVCRAIFRWVLVDPEKRGCHISELLGKCCLTEVSREYLTEEVAFMDILDKTARSQVQLAIKARRQKHLQSSMELNFRACSGKEQTFIMVTKKNEDLGEDNFKFGASPNPVTLLSLSSRTKTWEALHTSLSFGNNSACCVFGDALYVSGGSGKDKRTVERYSGSGKKTDRMESLPFPLKNHTMVAVNENLFAIGGVSDHSDSGQVVRYCIETNSWNIDGDLVFPVKKASAVALGDKIYIFGGKSNAAEDGEALITAVQMYDTTHNCAEIVTDLPGARSFTAAVSKQNMAYIVTCDGEVLKYTGVPSEIETIAKIPDFHRENFGVNIAEQNLYVYGGMEMAARFADELIDEVVVVSLPAGNVSKGKPMPFACEVFGFGNIITTHEKKTTQLNNSTLLNSLPIDDLFD